MKVTQFTIRTVQLKQQKETLFGTKKYRVYLKLLYIVIYKFVYCCENSFIGRTTKRLGSMIGQHVPKYAMDLF